ncbi:MAG: hypothetical protein ACTMIA_01380 [Vibrio sp.]
MLTRYTSMTDKSQSYLFTFGLLLTFLGMTLTDMWMPMVVGAFILTGLTVESWIRVSHLLPMQDEIRALRQDIQQLRHENREHSDQA